MHYTFQEIKNILTGESQIVSNNAPIEYLLTDSRNMNFPQLSLFIAIKGKQQDGHNYIDKAYEAGVRNFIVEEAGIKKYADANILFVKNSIDALQQIAAYHRRKFSIDIIGITGSNGKTIVKEWIYHLLCTEKNICRNPKSYNSQLGVPLSVLQLEPMHDLGIFEAGISLPGEMEKLEKIIKPTIGIFTNVGAAHDEGFANTEEKVTEKLKLFSGENLDVLFFCNDYTSIEHIIKRNMPHGVAMRWSKTGNSNADIQIHNIQRQKNKTVFDIELIGRQIMNLEIPFDDDASLENAIYAILIADNFGLHEYKIKEGLQSLSPVSMRLELKKGINNCQIINDAYSADISSLQIAMHFLNRHRQNLSTCVILSDFDESGLPADLLYRKVADVLQENNIEKFIGIGETIAMHKHIFSEYTALHSSFYDSTESFVKQFDAAQFQNTFILIKGARRFRLESISNLLTEKTHGTYLQIHLNHLIHNLQVYKGMLKPNVKMMVMVKAFSYGSGAEEIASALHYNHVDYLAVAYTDEGITLRKNGVHLPIMVMSPEPDAFDQMLEHNLEPEIYSMRILKLFLDFLQGENRNEIKIHIKIDTGMHRLGFTEQEIPELIKVLKQNTAIRIASIFSHLAAADEEKEDAFTKKQIQVFDKISLTILTEYNYPILRHILNSSGISKFPDGQFDMVRLGIGLYGDDPAKQILEKLLPVSYLFTTVAQIKNVQKGESIGYGRSAYAEKDMRIATLNIGYADGFNRRLSNGVGKVFIGENYAQVVGKVCMDMIMVDITDIEHVQEGDTAEVFGEHISLQEYAAMMQTIPYEVLTNISQRVKRVYVQE